MVLGPNRNNGLVIRPGHIFDDYANENPGATAIATGAKDVVEGVYSSGQDTVVLFGLAIPWGSAGKINCPKMDDDRSILFNVKRRG